MKRRPRTSPSLELPTPPRSALALLLSGFDELQSGLSSLAKSTRQPFAFVEPLLTHALENERIFRAVVGRQSGHQVEWRFRDMVVSLLLVEVAALKVPSDARVSTARFLAGGFLEQMREGLDMAGASAAVLAARFKRLALGVVETARG